MDLKLVKQVITDTADARKLWNDKTSTEVKEVFRRQHDAYLAKDSTIPVPEGLPHFYAAMEAGELGLLKVLEQGVSRLFGEEVPTVAAGGEIEGDGKYETHDLGWVKAFVVFMENLAEGKYEDLSIPPQLNDPAVISNNATIAIIGDWGTGFWDGDTTPASMVAEAVQGLNPDVVLHLGDVYYDGSTPEVKDKLVDIIPTGSIGTFNLNSNHDMYSVAEPYFKAIKSAPFAMQGDTSYFALTNDNWIIVGLDTAYLSDVLNGFMYGTLGKLELLSFDLISNEQTAFLIKMAEQAVAENKKLILSCHHNAYDGAGLTNETPLDMLTKRTLWEQVSTLIEPYLQGNKAYWYWGHAHCAYVMKERGNIFPRCIGHSAVPWGKGSDFYLDGDSNLDWFEDTPMEGKPPLLVNGFMTVTFSGETITETFYTQTGMITYSAINGVRQPI